MRQVSLAAMVVIGLSAPSYADPCTDLVDSARTALSMEGLDPSTRSQLEQLLKAGQAGDPLQCEKATGSIFQSSPDGERGPASQKCSETLNSV